MSLIRTCRQESITMWARSQPRSAHIVNWPIRRVSSISTRTASISTQTATQPANSAQYGLALGFGLSATVAALTNNNTAVCYTQEAQEINSSLRYAQQREEIDDTLNASLFEQLVESYIGATTLVDPESQQRLPPPAPKPAEPKSANGSFTFKQLSDTYLCATTCVGV